MESAAAKPALWDGAPGWSEVVDNTPRREDVSRSSAASGRSASAGIGPGAFSPASAPAQVPTQAPGQAHEAQAQVPAAEAKEPAQALAAEAADVKARTPVARPMTEVKAQEPPGRCPECEHRACSWAAPVYPVPKRPRA